MAEVIIALHSKVESRLSDRLDQGARCPAYHVDQSTTYVAFCSQLTANLGGQLTLVLRYSGYEKRYAHEPQQSLCQPKPRGPCSALAKEYRDPRCRQAAYSKKSETAPTQCNQEGNGE